jgi:hypothetical protein
MHPQIRKQIGLKATWSVRIRRPGMEAGFRLASLSYVEVVIGGIDPRALCIPPRLIGLTLRR